RRVRSLLEVRSDSAAVHVMHGRILDRQGDRSGAVRAFDRAIELDPLMPAGYFHLARAAIEAGDLRRAVSALGTYQRLSDTSAGRVRAAERMAAALDQLLGALEE